ncbi:type II toxin-antitoxin system CcdA family antitoxin [Metapseudomonas otitidis]|uniref:type II toxin-antitoxin system CcdA family antitoxin n=1 Tax=Metapseudomonas otitidis TaxID=319939 RepID=UPI0040556114
MPVLYDPRAPKKPVRLGVNGDLLGKARALGIDLPTTLEQALVEVLRARQREAWLAENGEAISAYNQHVENNGVFSDGLRRF